MSYKNQENQKTKTKKTAYLSPYIEIPRYKWRELAPETPLPLSKEEIEKLRGLGEPLDENEVKEIYQPLSRLLNLQVSNRRSGADISHKFLQLSRRPTPFIIGVAGSVAVGKSTISRLLKELLARWEDTPKVQLVTTDGFLYTNNELEKRKIAHRKGFPESYDRRALLNFLQQIKSGKETVTAPVYSHLIYDIDSNRKIKITQPDILIIEGLNVLQANTSRHAINVSDYFDFSIYVDARSQDIETWFIDRFLKLKEGAFKDPESYFKRFADLTIEQATYLAKEYWQNVNEPNLRENIIRTRGRADLILKKETDHKVHTVLLRRL